MNQTKLVSFIEQFVNVGSGLITAYFYWKYAILYQLNNDIIFLGRLLIDDTFIITLQFTGISVLRGFFWRRFFNNGFHLMVMEFVRKIY